MCSGIFQPNNIYDTPYYYEINDIKTVWYCVLWYDGPLIWENNTKTHLLFSGDYTSQFETYKMYEISNDAYNVLVEELTIDKENNIRTDMQGPDVLYAMGIVPTEFYTMHSDHGKLMLLDEEVLREVKPEIFI